MNIDINQGMTLEKKISTIIDSRDLINQILETYYGTDNEKDDIRRNIEHIKLFLAEPDIYAAVVEQDLLNGLNDIMARAETILGN